MIISQIEQLSLYFFTDIMDHIENVNASWEMKYEDSHLEKSRMHVFQ